MEGLPFCGESLVVTNGEGDVHRLGLSGRLRW